MNVIFLSILVAVFLFSIFSFFFRVLFENGIPLIGLMVTGVMLLSSTMPHMGKETYESRPAVSTRSFNEIFVQVNGWPTQVVNDIRFIDPPLKVIRKTSHNAWGCDPRHTYSVDTIEPSEKSLAESNGN